MDREGLNKIAEILAHLLENEPSDEELNYDDDIIEVYAELHNLKEALENIGIEC